MFRHRFFVIAVMVIGICGCGDEGVLRDEMVPSAPSVGDVVTEVPAHIQSLLWDKFGTREELVARLIALEAGDPQTDEEFMADWLMVVICKMDRNRKYFRKYINAGGVAVVGNELVPDAYFIEAKRTILQMTAKRPELREKLYPRNGGRYMVILQWDASPRELPFSASYALGECGGGLCWATVGHDHDYTRVKMNTFVHEFAHAIHYVISKQQWTRTDPVEPLPPLDATFDDRLQQAYAAAKAANKWRHKNLDIIDGEVVEVDGGPAYIMKNPSEYWAEGVVYWYYLNSKSISFASRAEFAAYDPLLYELLSEWLHAGSFE